MQLNDLFLSSDDTTGVFFNKKNGQLHKSVLLYVETKLVLTFICSSLNYQFLVSKWHHVASMDLVIIGASNGLWALRCWASGLDDKIKK